MAMYPGLEFDEPEQVKPETIEFIYIFDTLESLVHLYQVARRYRTEANTLDPTILTALLKDEGFKLMTALQDISIIDNSYLNIINPGTDDG